MISSIVSACTSGVVEISSTSEAVSSETVVIFLIEQIILYIEDERFDRRLFIVF